MHSLLLQPGSIGSPSHAASSSPTMHNIRTHDHAHDTLAATVHTCWEYRLSSGNRCRNTRYLGGGHCSHCSHLLGVPPEQRQPQPRPGCCCTPSKTRWHPGCQTGWLLHTKYTLKTLGPIIGGSLKQSSIIVKSNCGLESDPAMITLTMMSIMELSISPESVS